MIQKHINKLFLLSLLLSTLGLISTSPTTSAANVASQYCESQYPNQDQGFSQQQREACTTGYNAGYAKKNKSSTCNKYTSQENGSRLKKACQDGFDRGVTDQKNSAANAGRDAAAAQPDPLSKATTCGKYSNKTNKTNCEKAYDKELLKRASSEGKKAGTDQAANPCASLGYGGDKVKKACQDAYEKADADIGSKGRNDCGGVQTYFEFNCGPTNTDKSGNQNPIFRLALQIVNWFTGIVAVAVIGGIVYGGFMYMTAADNSGQTKQAITIIVNAVVALIALLMTFTVINFIVPGGLFV